MKTFLTLLFLLTSVNLYAAIEFSEDSSETIDAQVEAVAEADEVVAVDAPEPAQMGSPTMPVAAMPPMMQSQSPVGGSMSPNRKPRPSMNGMGGGMAGMGMGMFAGGGGGSVIEDELAVDGEVATSEGDDLLEGFVCDVVGEDAVEPSDDDIAEIVGAEAVSGGEAADEVDVAAGDAMSGGAAVPEPATIAVWSLLALCGLTFAWRRR